MTRSGPDFVSDDVTVTSHSNTSPGHITYYVLVMSIGNQIFGIPRNYQNEIGIWYFCPKFLCIFLVFYMYFANELVRVWLKIGIFRQNKNWFGIWFLWFSFNWYRFGFGL